MAISAIRAKIIPAGMRATNPPTKPTPIPTAPQRTAREKLRQMSPSAAPRKRAIHPPTTGNSSIEAGSISSSAISKSLINGSRSAHPANPPTMADIDK
jgi:hypothetical protein